MPSAVAWLRLGLVQASQQALLRNYRALCLTSYGLRVQGPCADSNEVACYPQQRPVLSRLNQHKCGTALMPSLGLMS